MDSLRKLTVYLLSNIGRLFTANRLKSLIEVGSTNTITEYLSHLEDTYLLYYVPKFDHSYRKQLVDPRKVYAVDTGLVRANSVSFNEDLGRLLENMVFLHIRRSFKEIYYFSGKRECDFVVLQKGIARTAIQVCYDLNPDNLERELNGINEAMEFFGLREGLLVTYSQHDSFDTAGGKVTVVPMAEFLLGSLAESG